MILANFSKKDIANDSIRRTIQRRIEKQHPTNIINCNESSPVSSDLSSSVPDVIPVLILDSYRCHMMASVVHRIQDLGVEVIHIPGGCTSLCQPVDVGLNKPFKECSAIVD